MLNNSKEVRENPETHDSTQNPKKSHVTIVGLHAASADLYDACLRIVEVVKRLEQDPALVTMLKDGWNLVTARLCAQQAIEKARVNS